MAKRVQVYSDEQKAVRRARSLAWAKANPDRVKEIQSKYHGLNREKRVAASVDWAKRNPHQRNAINVAYRDRDRQKLAERTAAWARKNPEKAAAIHRNRRARKRGAEGFSLRRTQGISETGSSTYASIAPPTLTVAAISITLPHCRVVAQIGHRTFSGYVSPATLQREPKTPRSLLVKKEWIREQTGSYFM